MDTANHRTANGRFAKGNPGPRVARRKGIPNKLTADIRQGIVDGAAAHGEDGKGKGGFAGYCRFLATKHPKVYASLIGRLLPLQVNAPRSSSGSINLQLVSIPSGVFLSPEQIAELTPQSDRRVIEHEPMPASDVFDSELEPLKS